MERMTREHCHAYMQRGLTRTMGEYLLGREALTLMDERDACARRLAAATAAFQRIAKWCESDYRPVVGFDDGEIGEYGEVLSGPSVGCDCCGEAWWPPVPEAHKDGCPVGIAREELGVVCDAAAQFEEQLQEAAAAHGPGAARGA